MSSTTLQRLLEAILFASGKGMTEQELIKHTESTPRKIQHALSQLKKEYENRETALEVIKGDTTWKLGVKGSYTEKIKEFVNETELANAILKTLAVIAFKSPVLQSDIIDMRGQGAYDHIKELVKEKFITKEKHKRSYMLKITQKFYNYFDVQGDEEIQEVFDRLREDQVKEQQLEIIDVKPEEKTKDNKQEQTEEKNESEEKQKDNAKQQAKEAEDQKQFLSDIDKKLHASSKRIQKEEIPTKHKEQEQSENKDDKTKTSKETTTTETNNNQEKKISQNNETSEEYIEEINEFVKKEQDDEKNKKQFL
ncbi:MAG: SMC-Scp complex subunit ScpB [Nanobdellota archaeon]